MNDATAPPVARAAAAPGGAHALLQRLEWQVLRPLDGWLHGPYRTPHRGQGIDLAGLREYQAGDDVRHLDWNVTARLGTPFVRRYAEDRDATAWFLADRSASMDFGSAGTTKLHAAATFVTLMARVLTRQGTRVGALVLGDGPRPEPALPPGRSRAHVLQLAHRLLTPARGGGQPTALAGLLHAAHHTLRRRAMVFVVSDFISQPGWAAALAPLVQRHDVVAVRITDSAEAALPDCGLLTLQDPETTEQITVDTGDAAWRARYAALVRALDDAVEAALSRAGVDVLELDAADDPADALLRLAELRRLRQRQAPAVRRRLP